MLRYLAILLCVGIVLGRPLTTFLVDEVTVGDDTEKPAVTGPLVRAPALAVDQPIPLPILARPQRDRTSAADAPVETGAGAALTKIDPRRVTPAPFAPLNLPNPFEYSQAIRLRSTVEEPSMPPPTTPRAPAK
jgi:hypothetical protein